MIRLILMPLALIILLSSCSNHLSITKRRYNKGFYVSVNKGAKSHDAVVKEKTSLRASKNTSAPVPFEVIPASEKAVIAHQTLATASDVKTTVRQQPKASVSNENHVQASASAPFISPARMVKELKATLPAKSSSGATDNNQVLLIILSLFPILSLIAVYLHDGKQFTMNFWITLLLHLVLLYWLFALLVVLDVIDLR